MQGNISYQTELLKITRGNINKLIEPFSLEQMNHIPEGFNNNLMWNFGHVIVTQQLLVYGLSGLPLNIDKELVEKYRKGSSPSKPVAQEEYNHLKELFEKLPNQTKIDYGTGLFKNYKSYTTSFNITLNSTEEGILFNNMHEAMHLGTMLAIKKFL